MIKFSKNELFLLVASTIFAVFIGLIAIGIFAPKLLGGSGKIFRIEGEMTFFENVFRDEKYNNDDFIIWESYTLRGIPLYQNSNGMGPNDILGFRNFSVPNEAHFVAIGDSQTYGNNARLVHSWPHAVVRYFDEIAIEPYSMAVGGWGAIDYFNALKYALHFKPKVVVVAFYTGNDPIETFKSAYAKKHWKDFRINNNLNIDDAPKVAYPPAQDDRWHITFNDGVKSIFTSEYRSHNVIQNNVIDTAFEIMFASAKKMADVASQKQVEIIFTIIPTKELVYAKKVFGELSGSDVEQRYRDLVTNEQKRIDDFSDKLSQIDNAVYVDVVSPLQNAALSNLNLYHPLINGHPVAEGYAVIAKSLSGEIGRKIVQNMRGPVAIKRFGKNEFFIVDKGLYWQVTDPSVITNNGWGLDNITLVTEGFFKNKKNMGKLTN